MSKDSQGTDEAESARRAEWDRLNTPPAPWSPEKKRFAWIMVALAAVIVVLVVGIIIVVNVVNGQGKPDCDGYRTGSTDYFLCTQG